MHLTTYLFPGQGSQSLGMGADLFQAFPSMTAKADEVLGFSIRELCLEDPKQILNQTQYTQPALYTVNALTYFHKMTQDTSGAEFYAGHSLGEYNALLAAGVFDFETGLRLVKKRGELMSQAANGGMAAIIGLSADTIKHILAEHDLHQVSIANYNSLMQLVISGQQDQVLQAQSLCQTAGARMVVPLKVSGAFHSPLMQAAQKEFSDYLSAFHFKKPQARVISNVTAKPYLEDEIHENLAKQIASPVRWVESMQYLLEAGVSEFEELGPGTVLTGLLKRIKNGQ